MLAISGCGGGSADVPQADVSAKPGSNTAHTVKPQDTAHTVKPQAPVQIAYRIIGTPIVGQPVAVDLQVTSMMGQREVTLSYRINDSTAMQFPEAQPPTVSLAPSTDELSSFQQVRVIPLREGRLFLNVSADIETDDGTMTTVTAIPIQVGATSIRVPQQHGVETTDENGEAIKVLKGE
jgi:hypothetical protein